jgi:hypothetical protein
MPLLPSGIGFMTASTASPPSKALVVLAIAVLGIPGTFDLVEGLSTGNMGELVSGAGRALFVLVLLRSLVVPVEASITATRARYALATVAGIMILGGFALKHQLLPL